MNTYIFIVEEYKHKSKKVGVYSDSEWIQEIKRCAELDERIILMELNWNDHEIVPTETYGPTRDSDINTKEEYFDKLTTVLTYIKTRKEILILGDLNAWRGKLIDSDIVGRHGEDDLLLLCSFLDLSPLLQL